jgi:hypothetical protein
MSRERHDPEDDFTPTAYKGAWMPDGPAPEVAEQLRQMGILADGGHQSAANSDTTKQPAPGANAGSAKDAKIPASSPHEAPRRSASNSAAQRSLHQGDTIMGIPAQPPLVPAAAVSAGQEAAGTEGLRYQSDTSRSVANNSDQRSQTPRASGRPKADPIHQIDARSGIKEKPSQDAGYLAAGDTFTAGAGSAIANPQPSAPAARKPTARRADTPPKRRAERRIVRSVRFESVIDAKLREVAAARGLDLNAAIAVAIAEDWWRYCASVRQNRTDPEKPPAPPATRQGH